jgi:hypothetical protein
MINKSTKDIISKIFDALVEVINNPISTGIAFALAVIALYFRFLAPIVINYKLNQDDLTNIGNFIEWFGVPYGLLIALVLVNVWTQFDATDRSFDREFDAVNSLYHTYLFVSDIRIKKVVINKIYEYVKHVQENYNEEYKDEYVNGKKYKTKMKKNGDLLLEDIRKQTGILILRENENGILMTELLRLVNELVDDRGDRLSFSRQRMPKAVMYLSYISSALWLIPFFTLSFSSPTIRILYLAGVTFVVISILLIVKDIDEPFSGTWGIEPKSWIELRNEIKSQKYGI